MRGGPAPPHQTAYDCRKWHRPSETCSTPDTRAYWIFSRFCEEDEPEWRPATPWQPVGTACITPEQGAAHEHLPEDQPWTTYIASYPGGDLTIEPPEGRTLTGMRTNFYSELPEEIEYPVMHNSGPVRMCAAPTQWVWGFGDDLLAESRPGYDGSLRVLQVVTRLVTPDRP